MIIIIRSTKDQRTANSSLKTSQHDFGLGGSGQRPKAVSQASTCCERRAEHSVLYSLDGCWLGVKSNCWLQ